MNKILSTIIALLIFTNYAYSQQKLNNLLTEYEPILKVSNTYKTESFSCIYNVYNIKTWQSGDNLHFEFGFCGFKSSREEVIDWESFSINLSECTIGACYNDKNIIFINDKKGIEMTIKGAQSYNQGVKKNIIESFYLKCNSEILANKILLELKEIQKNYKPEVVEVSTSESHSCAESFDTLSEYFNTYKIYRGYKYINSNVSASYSRIETNYNLQFQYPYLIIKYKETDKPTDYSGCPDKNITIKIPISDMICNFTKDSFLRKYYIEISSLQGIITNEDGKDDIVKSIYYISSEIICKKLYDELIMFQSLVKKEDYRGAFNISKSIPQNTPKPKPIKPKTINNKYSQ
ncbi:MAG: hypothetical protein R3Y59_10480 [bacterium]